MLRKIRNIAISVGILLVLFIGAGVAYTFYMSQTETPKIVTTPVVDKKNTITHVKIAANAPASASVQSITTPIMPGDNASISIKSNPGSSCAIKVEYNKIPSTDSGLKDKVSDEFGITTWSWTIEPTAPEGKWPVSVTCTYNTKTAVVVGDLVVSKTILTE
ncbi:MAG: hypothetical protein ABIP50_01065 [Candidatus Saccharimonadales bacterium]